MVYEVKSGEPYTFRLAGVDFLINLEFSGNISDLSLPNASVLINRQAFNDPEEAQKLIVESELCQWPLSDEDRLQLANMAMITTVQSLRRTPRPPDHNYFELRFSVSHHEEIDHEEDDDRGGGVINMVPATEESIRNLERKKSRVAGSGSVSGCPVCLEEFSMDCEVVHMPCEHDFHVDCIEKWLRKSHYCPLCRFQMPTN